MKGPVRIEGLRVEVKNGNFEKAFRLFNKKVQDSGKLREYKDRMEYVKPSINRKKDKQLAKKREQKRVYDDKMSRGLVEDLGE